MSLEFLIEIFFFSKLVWTVETLLVDWSWTERNQSFSLTNTILTSQQKI